MELRRHNGQVIRFASSAAVGIGGEARIFVVSDPPGMAAKVYHRPTPHRAAKLSVMLANPPNDPMAGRGHVSIAWPVETLIASGGPGRVVGFLMPFAAGMDPIIDFYQPRIRREERPLFNYLYLIRTARNLAACLRALHARGYVIGDLNESNVLVAERALVTLVDTDSIQVPDLHHGQFYRCLVGKPEFTAPEVHAQLRQGRTFADIDRLPEHDAFALAVLIFQLLMEGVHPFAGPFPGRDETPSYEERILGGHFPYCGRSRTPCRPMRFAPPFGVLHPRLQELLRRSFVDGHVDPKVRPDAHTWKEALDEAEDALTTCTVNEQHQYGRHLNSCPWCERRDIMRGLDPFPSKEAVGQGRHLQPVPTVRRTPPIFVKTPPPTKRARAPARRSPAHAPPPRPTARAARRAWSALFTPGSPQTVAALLLVIACVMFAASSGWRTYSWLLRPAARQDTTPKPAEQVVQVAHPVVGRNLVVPDLGMELVYIEPGSFQMGSDSGNSDEKPVHTVRISRAFWMGKCEVTQAQYEAVMRTNPSHFQGLDLPVENVSWHDAVAFCRKLTDRERQAGRLPMGYVYRLPTEAEWEYAARGGSESRGFEYAGSNTLDEVAWNMSNSGDRTHPVGQKRANELSLYDMSGNVWEWCHDVYDVGYYAKSPSSDPMGPSSGGLRVVRGGSWYYIPWYDHSSTRRWNLPDHRSLVIGIRVVASWPLDVSEAGQPSIPVTAEPASAAVAAPAVEPEPVAPERVGGTVAGQNLIVPELGMEMVYVEPGSFQMGSNSGDSDEKPVHTVRISRPFWMGKCEVTQSQYEALTGRNPSNFKGSDLPVENVSWNDAVEFCRTLSDRERQAGRLPQGCVYRLPTEAEWEYAARGGSKSRGFEYAGSGNLDEVAWCSDNSGGKTHPVGQKRPNELGLCDMSGNVWEWCHDGYDESYYAKSPSSDPTGASSAVRVLRGGSWFYGPTCCRSTARHRLTPDATYSTHGFRVVAALPAAAQEPTPIGAPIPQPQPTPHRAESEAVRDAKGAQDSGTTPVKTPPVSEPNVIMSLPPANAPPVTIPGDASAGVQGRVNIGPAATPTTGLPQAEQERIEQLRNRSRDLYAEGDLESARRGFVEVARSGLYKGPEGTRPEDYIATIDRLLAASQLDTTVKPSVALPGRSTKDTVKVGEPSVGATESMVPQRIQADLVEVREAQYASLAGLASGSQEAQERQRRAVQQLGSPLEVRTSKTGIVFRLVPAGSFTMGSPSSEGQRDGDETQHQVTLSKAFYCGKFEVTQGQWQQVMGSNPSSFRNVGVDAPVENVSWEDCQAFVKKLCQTEGVSEGTYRLLTEAEWEYACRAGTQTAFCYGNDLDSSLANFNGGNRYGTGRQGEYRRATVRVGSFRPNAWGLHDMFGNVWEWCQDWYGEYSSGSATDPLGPRSGRNRVYRGGGWDSYTGYCRSANRSGYTPGFRYENLGLRLARTMPLVTPEETARASAAQASPPVPEPTPAQKAVQAAGLGTEPNGIMSVSSVDVSPTTTPGATSVGPDGLGNVDPPVKEITGQPQAEQQRIEHLHNRSRELFAAGEWESARRGFVEVARSGLYKGPEGTRPEDYIATIDRLSAASQPDTTGKPLATSEETAQARVAQAPPPVPEPKPGQKAVRAGGLGTEPNGIVSVSSAHGSPVTTPGVTSLGPEGLGNAGSLVKATTGQSQPEQQRIEELHDRSRELYFQGELASARRGFAEVARSGLYKGPEGTRPEDYISAIDRLLAASQPDAAGKLSVALPGRSTKEAPKGGEPTVAARAPMDAQRIQADFTEIAGAEYVSLAGLASGSRGAQERQRQAVRDLGLPLEIRTQKTGIVFRLVPAGSFTMGSPKAERDAAVNAGVSGSSVINETEHQVTLTKAFYCGKFEVTQGQWQQVMGSNPSYFKNTGQDAPVEQVSWDDCQAFMKKLCQMEGVSEGTYRLLTEAEWEYACRAGTQTAFCYGNDLDSSMANFDGRYAYSNSHQNQYRQTTVAVGRFRPNGWGLHDMHGNVWEWCQDWSGGYPSGSVTDPAGPASGTSRVGRGGSWINGARGCCSALRTQYAPGSRLQHLGFRLARTIPASSIWQILQVRPEDVLRKVKISG